MRGHTHRASILFIYLAQEVVQSEAIDPDTLFVTVVAVITITGFVLSRDSRVWLYILATEGHGWQLEHPTIRGKDHR